MASFGEWLTERMAHAGLGQTDLANMLGIRSQSVWQWMHDVAKPTRENTKALARALRLPAPDVFQALGVPMPYRRGDDPELDAALALFEALHPEARAAALAMMRGLLVDRESADVHPPIAQAKEP